jgi:5-methylcytosine-specific restriction endonuclease McrA
MKWFKCCHCKTELPETSFYRDASKVNGHLPRCKECFKLYRTKEVLRISEKIMRSKNPEKRAIILKRYYEKNKLKHKNTQDKYRQTLEFQINHKKHCATRRARILNAFIEPVNYFIVYTESNKKCFYCGKQLKFKEVEFDHYIPISKGGLHKKDNIRCSCSSCNRFKGAKMPVEVCY